MEHFGEFIDYDEGRDIDPREAFYTNALPCESCGQPIDDRRPAPWDTSLQVGECCYFCVDFEVPNLPSCIRLWEAIENCKSVNAVRAVFSAHAYSCPICKEAEALPEAA
jgi:hypothetical protein